VLPALFHHNEGRLDAKAPQKVVDLTLSSVAYNLRLAVYHIKLLSILLMVLFVILELDKPNPH